MRIIPQHTPGEVLRDVWWIGALSLGVALIATPIVRHLAYRYKIVDRPDDLLKPHGRPIAYMGGLAMCTGLLVGLVAYGFTSDDGSANWAGIREAFSTWNIAPLANNPMWHLLGFAVSALIITMVGLIDDIKVLNPRQKVIGQVAAAGVLFMGGVGQRIAPAILGSVGISLPFVVTLPLSFVFLMVMVVSTCNATNLLDGLDGLCGGVTGIISLGFLALAVHLALSPLRPATFELRMMICLAMAGGVIGFLPYNVPPASIFMGDAGSMLLGFFVAVLMAMFCREGYARWLLAACAIFALPILDTGLAVIRRLLSGKGIFVGDRSHLYDQLVDRGMSVKQVVALFYVLAAFAAILGVTLAICIRARYAAMIYAVLLIGIAITFCKLGMFRPQPHQPKGTVSSDDDKQPTGDEG